tara:strand:- start:210 stop:587 length:378 start_codon:yes stop_codon:yes gene_type:complete
MRIKNILSLTILLTFITSCGQSPVDMVKDGVLDSCPTKTIGEMVSSELIMNSPSWEYFEADDGMTYVNLEGLVEYEVVSNVLVQFIIKKDKSGFVYNAMEIDEEPQEEYVADILLAAMCSPEMYE